MPAQQLELLGLLFDTRSFMAALSLERQDRLLATLSLVLSTKLVDVMILAHLMDLLVSCHQLIDWARFHLRSLQAVLQPDLQLIERNVHRAIPVPSSLKKDLRWWNSRERLSAGVSLLDAPQVILTMDACLVGWGAHLEGKLLQGHWSTQESRFSIDLLELRAIRLALLGFQPYLGNKMSWYIQTTSLQKRT